MLLRKGVYPYGYTDDCKKFNETTLPEKEDITDVDYLHAKRVCKDFEMKNLSDHLHLYLKTDTLLLTDVFQTFRKMYLNIYHLDPIRFLPAPGLAWQAALKKTEVKQLEEEYVMQFIDILKLITNI